MPLPRIGFAKRFLVLYGFIFVLILLITDWTLSRTFEQREFSQLKISLTRQSKLASDIMAPLLAQRAPLQSAVEKVARDTENRVTVIETGGIVLADSSESALGIAKMDNHLTRPEVAAALRGLPGSASRYSMTLNTQMLYVAAPIFHEGKISGVVRLAMPATRIDKLLAAARRPIFFWASAGILIILISGILFANHLTARIRKITRVADRYAKEDWTEKIVMDGHDELRLLGDTMNHMAGALHSRIQDLEGEKGKIAAILNNMTEAVIAIDRRKQVITANPNAERLFEFVFADLRGKSLIEITKHPQLEMIVDQSLREQKTLTDEIRLSLKSKNILRVSVVSLGANAQNIGGILVFYDITELRRLENIRKEFVANASHELRTPLTSIRGFIETLLGGAMKDASTSEKFLKIMQDDATRLGRLVDDILTLGEIEQGSVPLRREEVDLVREMREVVERFKFQLESKKMILRETLPGVGLKTRGDRDKIRQVFVNLIDNAIKFSHEKGILRITAEREGKDIRLSIEDTGIGIPKELMGRIFERFFRVDKARSRDLGGTGLGLAIVKHIMESHGGRVTCESEPGKGARFTVFFPAA